MSRRYTMASGVQDDDELTSSSSPDEGRALSPQEEAFCRAYVALGGRGSDAARQAGYHERAATKLLKRPDIRRRINELVEETLSQQGLTKTALMERILSWIGESIPHERVRAAELLARLADWFPAERRVTHHVAVAAMGGPSTYEQLTLTLREYGDRFEPQQLRMIRSRLEQDRSWIEEALALLEHLEAQLVVEALPPGSAREH